MVGVAMRARTGIRSRCPSADAQWGHVRVRWHGDRTFAGALPTNAQLRCNGVAGIEVLFGRESEETYTSGIQ
eukprot:6016680-Prymnesium_polylepis.1